MPVITVAAIAAGLGILALAFENGILASVCAAVIVIMLGARYLP